MQVCHITFYSVCQTCSHLYPVPFCCIIFSAHDVTLLASEYTSRRLAIISSPSWKLFVASSFWGDGGALISPIWITRATKIPVTPRMGKRLCKPLRYKSNATRVICWEACWTQKFEDGNIRLWWNTAMVV